MLSVCLHIHLGCSVTKCRPTAVHGALTHCELLSQEASHLYCRVERGATPRRLASELGSQANSMSAVPPLPSSMLRFSGQQASQLPGKTLPSPEQPEPVQFEESVQSKPSRGPSQAAGPSQQQQEKQQQPPSASQLPAVVASIGAGAAVGVAAASAAKPLAAEGPNHKSKVIPLSPYSKSCMPRAIPLCRPLHLCRLSNCIPMPLVQGLVRVRNLKISRCDSTHCMR